MPWPYSEPLIALDLFAGHGWGVAAKRCRIVEYGVELMDAAVRTRDENGLYTWMRDVWDVFDADRDRIRYQLLIASPPCQTFSVAGAKAGVGALREIIRLIKSQRYLDIPVLREFGERHDPRTALVLTPLALIFRDLPRFVVLEQVPGVQPVWDAYAEEMRLLGYSVWTGKVYAEQYGVPQTRVRSILIGRRDGIEAAPPTPTHSRYYPQDPTRVDPGMPRWVTMAEALGWGMTERPMVAFGNSVGRGRGAGGSGGLRAIEREIDRGAWVPGHGLTNRPAPTITGGGTETGGAEPIAHLSRYTESESWRTREEARKLRSNYGTNGNSADRGERTEDQPAPTITSKADRNKWEPWDGRPATTVTTRERLSNPGANANRFNNSTKSRNDGENLTLREAATLQTYPADFTFAGNKTEQFLQVGNAVPPRLAEAILRTLM